MGEAYFVRALMYHDLVKYFGDVPIQLHPTTDPNAGSSITRSPVSAVYDQITADLDSAATRISDSSSTTTASGGAVRALRARVLFYKGDYAGAEAEAAAVENDFGYELASNYSDLFTANGNATPEDIFKVIATVVCRPAELPLVRLLREGARRNVPASARIESNLLTSSDYDPTDLRGQWNISFAGQPAIRQQVSLDHRHREFPGAPAGRDHFDSGRGAGAQRIICRQAVAEMNRTQARAACAAVRARRAHAAGGDRCDRGRAPARAGARGRPLAGSGSAGSCGGR